MKVALIAFAQNNNRTVKPSCFVYSSAKVKYRMMQMQAFASVEDCDLRSQPPAGLYRPKSRLRLWRANTVRPYYTLYFTLYTL